MRYASCQMKLGTQIPISEGQWNYIAYRIMVKNAGNTVARNCWPQLAELPESLNGAFEAQSIAWESELSQPGAALHSVKDIQPAEELGFFIIHTSQQDSENESYGADVPVGRREEREQLIVAFPPGQHDFKIRLVGDNIKSPTLSLRLSLSEVGSNTWETLTVEERHWWRRRTPASQSQTDSTGE